MFSGLLAGGLAQTQMPTGPMSFFLTSAGSGNGGDLGGLAGADSICQNLAESVDAGDLTWRAYLSTHGTQSTSAVNARDRIGNGLCVIRRVIGRVWRVRIIGIGIGGHRCRCGYASAQRHRRTATGQVERPDQENGHLGTCYRGIRAKEAGSAATGDALA